MESLFGGGHDPHRVACSPVSSRGPITDVLSHLAFCIDLLGCMCRAAHIQQQWSASQFTPTWPDRPLTKAEETTMAPHGVHSGRRSTRGLEKEQEARRDWVRRALKLGCMLQLGTCVDSANVKHAMVIDPAVAWPYQHAPSYQ